MHGTKTHTTTERSNLYTLKETVKRVKNAPKGCQYYNFPH
jgi:hypothetical protein